ncbi:CopG family transcriptional regulator [Smithella sp. SCADC]|jgi:predicted transcriptional regulator|nr:CopG family transcriptional regulator [Smithella sp. SCADC]
MPRVVTLRLNDDVYHLFDSYAKDDNRTLSNFIETAARRYIEQNIEYADEYEMDEIKNNTKLNDSIKRGVKDAKNKKGRFVA